MRSAIGRRRGMNEDDGPPLLQLLEDGVELLVAEIDAARVREENDAIELQYVEGIRKLAEGTVDVGQRQAPERTKPVRTRLHELCGKLVAAASQRSSTPVIPRVDARRADRRHRDVDARIVHERQRTLPRPWRRSDSADGAVLLVRLPPEKVG